MNATAKDFYLEKEMDFLNNGSFGACPKSVIAVQRQWQELMESQLIRFFMKELPAAMRTSAQALAPMIGANPNDIAFVDNATSGCNAVIRSLMPTGLRVVEDYVDVLTRVANQKTSTLRAQGKIEAYAFSLAVSLGRA